MKNQQELKIFIVDDNKTCLTVYKNTIEKLGYNAVSVFDNSTDFLLALTEQPHVVIIDYSLDHLNGIDLLLKIKRQDPNVFVIFLSGQDDINIAVSALKYGALDYVKKSDFSKERISKLMEKVHIIRENIALKKRKKNISSAIASAASMAALYLTKPLWNGSNH